MSDRAETRGTAEGAPDVGELTPPDRTLMGPGPSDVHPRVLRAMSTPLVGHLDPSFVEMMDEVQELLRYAFRTDNRWTIPVSGTGSAAMEAAIGNLVEPGDTMLVPTNGYFGGRMASMAGRAGGEVVEVDAPWGEPLDPADVAAAFDEHQPDVFGFVHAETSTGVLQPEVPELTAIAHDHDAYVIADTVTSLGGVELRVDDWNVDVAYSGPQKCLSCPPGASPLTLNDRAMDKVLDRETDARSWYLDLSLLEGYWGDDRSYHHTAPITNVYALREALRLVAEEGIEKRWARHREVAGDLKAGLQELGLEMNAPDDYWLPSLNAVRVPDGVDDAAVIDHLIAEYDLEIAGGLGDLAGDIWRIGCMGHSARPKNVEYLLAALEDALAEQGAL
ncbi:pyridoxal-phosphate-dependent aminotransferase family protein [Halopenitus persicus]|uniref:Alanine-glyoxylate transaminase / serine-glyoxylate transaminase / serine-pyruvate transaminase n=1 Tax=Halopenitus persicus TaxID=1048396 RepID=A0A1H3HBF3_9EURY|nr:alanine--glyoxylate aminotransferase family protein [Halopenitus persicus]QHS16027.1 alanine--glyoxylate aminotransferase family protein [haloarchaeon 3A1-DGR]SDY12923.1 alanine-glyoxylate transaminase / serine-glyoxylate transaminase / serine-pyruvate transaminase [Halopenitus persicus]